LKLFNKDFRLITREEIPQGSVDLVLILDLPEPRLREDEGGRIHMQLMERALEWLKEGGILAIYVEQRYLQRAICTKPPMLQFYHILSLSGNPSRFYEQPNRSTMLFTEDWRPICIYVKGHTSPHPPQVDHPTSDCIDCSTMTAEEEAEDVAATETTRTEAAEAAEAATSAAIPTVGGRERGREEDGEGEGEGGEKRVERELRRLASHL
jgi:hypothetical protein